MHMTSRLKRWTAMLLLAVVAFAQASLAYSACQLERNSLSKAIRPAAAAVHRDCESPIVTEWTKYPNRCLMHCSADLQTVGAAVALIRAPAAAPVLVLDWPQERAAMHTGLDAAPAGAPPPRILFHSFLI